MEAKSFLSKTYVQVLLSLILLAVLVALGAYAHLTLKQARGTYTGDTTISVTGEGKAVARPDIGQFSFSVRAEGTDAAEAQEKSAESINAILAYLEGAGVEEKDIKTQNYYLNPKYRYEERICAFDGYCPPGEPILDGYEVSQSVTVKVRDLDKSGELIAGVGEQGATNISSLQFTVDDETVIKSEARQKAIANAKAKAEQLAKDLDVKIVRMVGFYENGGDYYPMMERGYGGDGMMYDMAESAANTTKAGMPTGESEVMSNVTITYEIR